MNKTEKELKASRGQLLAELKECNNKLDAIKAEREIGRQRSSERIGLTTWNPYTKRTGRLMLPIWKDT